MDEKENNVVEASDGENLRRRRRRRGIEKSGVTFSFLLGFSFQFFILRALLSVDLKWQPVIILSNQSV